MDAHSDTAAANGPKSADRARIVEASPGSRVRSRLTNHKDLLPNLDGRSAAARRFRDLVKSLVIDQGGFSKCSEVKLGLLRRLAAVTVQSELLEAKMVNGEAIDIGTLCMLAFDHGPHLAAPGPEPRRQRRNALTRHLSAITSAD